MPPDHLSPYLPLLPPEQMIPRIAAILPAAGLSRRMGQPKLLLSLGGRSVISRVIESLRTSGISPIVVVVRADDVALMREVQSLGVTLVQPVPAPPQMRDSVQAALHYLQHDLGDGDGWMLIPADHPCLQGNVIRQIARRWLLHPEKIVIPAHHGRRGHPTLFPWSIASEVFTLSPDQGLNAIVRARPDRVDEIEVDSPEILVDLDTPEDWQRLQAGWKCDFRQNPPSSDGV